ncbi:hypothetical protein MT349_03005 [Rathayibacter caricis]|uniref:hypothetical protein n=1 Tax=Rathayibacter caricis TaxID=110936 RepID=UPI001FB482EA|nr:hypothetical protein [Rathayibacter caricis]MCJ1694739.1 hypothetical protein [Rathayibacter caricis]
MVEISRTYEKAKLIAAIQDVAVGGLNFGDDSLVDDVRSIMPTSNGALGFIVTVTVPMSERDFNRVLDQAARKD